MEQLRLMQMTDHEQMMALWEKSDGVVVSEADTPTELAQFLQRNPGLSYVAEQDGQIIGTVLGGHDGRRGFLYHLAVEQAHRGRRLGQRLAEACLHSLAEQGITKCHIFVVADNEDGQRFWTRCGWEKRDTFFVYSRSLA
ncbi:GNAT family N-acetyltransferase [Paenibacillus sp. JX-17]|uniref:GNAT family N-acetyltransferase n=1 Tax=Paenibacillus lacisoli TaxID=3064525 RepID=A0ABT9CCE2_9BACL|nr:GNAT family N-acetyltransferase [Paenibacillus sp. JX-17]MDO7906930.1 GNAT family N-acetyltransferase [Paenibacillus sp. JX-17]